jgi:hypothetical protein
MFSSAFSIVPLVYPLLLIPRRHHLANPSHVLHDTSEHRSRLNGPCRPEQILARDHNLDRVLPLHVLRPACRIRQMLAFPPISSQKPANPLPQYAHFLPKYFPIYGTTTIVNNSSSCCKLSFHSRSASDSSGSSSESMSSLSAESGRESTEERSSSACEGEPSSIT